MKKYTKKAKIEFLKSKMKDDKKWAVRGLIRVYQLQTSDEQQGHTVTYANGVGFTAFDADILSSFAEQVGKGRSLSDKQVSILKRLMPKYAGQLLTVADTTKLTDLMDKEVVA